MQTFCPYPNFTKSAQCLDNKRLGNQRNEAWILYQAITIGNGWSKHPAAKMWKEYPIALLEYGRIICLEWREKGFNDTMIWKFMDELNKKFNEEKIYPDWLGDEKFHASHRSNLLRKNHDWYSKFKWEESDDLPYVWPVE